MRYGHFVVSFFERLDDTFRIYRQDTNTDASNPGLDQSSLVTFEKTSVDDDYSTSS